MKYLLSILLICSICLTQEMEVDGDLKVTGSIESATIDSLMQVIAQLQAQLAAMQAAGGWESRMFEHQFNNFPCTQQLILLDFLEITNYDFDFGTIKIISVTNYSGISSVQLTMESNNNIKHEMEFGENVEGGYRFYNQSTELIITPIHDEYLKLHSCYNNNNQLISEVSFSISFLITAQFPN